MRRRIRKLSATLIAAASLLLVSGELPASATGVNQGVVPSAVPGKTPHIADGSGYKVLDMAQVGNRIVVVGIFAQVQNPSASGAPTGPLINRANIFAFDSGTGLVDTAFAPRVTGGAIDAVEPGPNNTVYIGGAFNTVNGATVRRLAQLNLANGTTVTTFKPTVSAEVQDIKLLGNRLFIAGSFVTVGGAAHGGLAAVDATTGKVDPYMSLGVAGHHNYGVISGAAQSSVGVVKIDINPAGNRMIAIGNFRTVEGTAHDQAVSILLQSGGAVVDTNWQAPGYQAPCKYKTFDSWVRDVQWAPDGSYFVIVSTGAYGANQLCDTAARFNASDTGQKVQPYWIAYTGGDSLFSVAITDRAVYVGGHPRWLNNPFAGDNAAAGAVPRPGLAALDPLSGVPLTWNPGRNPRGAPLGAQSILATAAGVYVGSDTNTIGSPKVRTYTRKKLAFFPVAGGTQAVSQNTGSLPGTIYLAGVGATNAVVKRTYGGSGTTPSVDSTAPDGGTAWSNARGAFMVGTTLYYGFRDASGTFEMARRSFNGTTFGPQQILSTPYKDPAWDGVSTGTKNGGLVYDGVFPNFYGAELGSVKGMFYANGRLYYATGSGSLLYRYFSVDSGIVGAQSFTAASSGFANAGGMFLDGKTLYVVNRANGNLTRMNFDGAVPTGSATVADTSRDWRGNAVFLLASGSAPAASRPPAAQFSSSCSGLTCSFDGSKSSDPDGDKLSYSWTFGDGGTSTAESPTHTYGAAGSFQVTLTVSDGQASGMASTTVTPSSSPSGNVAFRAGAQASTPNGGVSISVTLPSTIQPGNGLVLVLSNNSGSSAATGVTGTASGFTQVGIERALVTGTANVAMTTQVFQKVATAGDAGARLTVSLSAGAKATLQVLVYSGTAPGGPVRSVVGEADDGGTSHATPSSTANAGDWVLSVWSDKNSAVRSWSAPSGEAVRSSIGSTGTNGEIATLLGDKGQRVADSGAVSGLTATVPTASAKATMLTVVLAGG